MPLQCGTIAPKWMPCTWRSCSLLWPVLCFGCGVEMWAMQLSLLVLAGPLWFGDGGCILYCCLAPATWRGPLSWLRHCLCLRVNVLHNTLCANQLTLSYWPVIPNSIFLLFFLLLPYGGTACLLLCTLFLPGLCSIILYALTFSLIVFFLVWYSSLYCISLFSFHQGDPSN